MKNRMGIIILILICVALAMGLIWSQKQAGEQRDQAGSYSNKWASANESLDKEKLVSAQLESDRTVQKEAYSTLSNDLARVAASLEKTEASLKTTQQDVTNQLAKISDLEQQNQALELRAAELNSSISNLTAQIADARTKLAAAEGDKESLTRELQQMVAEKSRLEQQFNDITVLRVQLAKVREDMNISRRLDWQRRGLVSDQKGAEALMQKTAWPTVGSPAPKRPTYDLNVEVAADGSVRVIGPATNRVPVVR